MAVVNRIVVLASDISGEEGARTFEIDPASVLRDIAKDYAKITLDVTEEEGNDISAELVEAFDTIREALQNATEYLYEINAGLKAAGSQTTGGAARKVSTGAGKIDPVRVWARENGYVVSDRGRMSAEVHAAFKAANAGKITNLDTTTPGESWDNSTASEGDVVTTDGPTDAELEALAAEGV